MKKTVRTYTKRTVAVFMATLMLLTAWVFVAPQKAEAVAAPSGGNKYGSFYVRLTYDVTDDGNFEKSYGGWGSDSNDGCGCTIRYTKNWNSETDYVDWDLKSTMSSTGTNRTISATIPGFPTGFYQVTNDNSALAWDNAIIEFTKIEVGPDSNHLTTIWTGRTHTNSTNGKKSIYFFAPFTGESDTSDYVSGCDGHGDEHQNVSTTSKNNWALPVMTSTVNTRVTDNEILVPTTSTPNYGYVYANTKDQFGVPFPDDETGRTGAFTSGSDNKMTFTEKSQDYPEDTWQLKVPQSSHVNGYETRDVKVKLTYKSGSTTKNSSDVLFKVKDYTKVTLNANSGTIKNSSGTDVAKTFYTYNGKLNSSQIPAANNSTRTGYTYKGMYPTQQTNKTKTDGNWTPTGSALSTSTDNTLDCTFYAAWQAKNVNVYFMDATGKFLCSDGNYYELNVGSDGFPVTTNGHTPKAYIGKYEGKLAEGQTAPAVPTFEQNGTTFSGGVWVINKAEQITNTSGAVSAYFGNIGSALDSVTLKGRAICMPKYASTSTNSYTVTALGKNGTTSTAETKTFGATYNLPAYTDGMPGAFDTYGATAEQNQAFTYTFKEWAEQKDAGDKVYFYDGEFDRYYRNDGSDMTYLNAGNWTENALFRAGAEVYPHVLPAGAAYTVVDDITFIPVYERVRKEYNVNYAVINPAHPGRWNVNGSWYMFAELTPEGEEAPVFSYKYGEKLSSKWPEAPKYNGQDNALNNDTGNGLGWTYTWTGYKLWGSNYDGADLSADTVCKGSGTYYATYAWTSAVYNITFLDGEGNVLNETATAAYDGERQGAPTATAESEALEAIAANPIYSDSEYKYTWIQDTPWVEEVPELITDDLVVHANYHAAKYYLVRFYSDSERVPGQQVYNPAGELIGTARLPVGDAVDTIPDFFDDENQLIVPKKAFDPNYMEEGQVFTFDGWINSEGEQMAQNDALIVPERDLDKNEINVFAHYDYVPKNYTIKFLSDDGETELIPTKTDYHYGEDVIQPTDEQKAKATDNRYTYEFMYWDHTVSETVTGDATYTAVYKQRYVPYQVLWLNPDGSEYVDENYYLDETIRKPFTPPTKAPDASLQENHNYVFDHWVYAVKNEQDQWIAGATELAPNTTIAVENAGTYVFFPVYRQALNTYCVTLYDANGTTVIGGPSYYDIGTILANVIADAPAKNPDATKHYAFDKWIIKGSDPAQAMPETLVNNLELQATYKQEDHKYQEVSMKRLPTFFENGEVDVICTTPGCRHESTIAIGKLIDSVKPSLRLYAKGQYWSATDPEAVTEVPENATPISIGSENFVIINTEDTANPTTLDVGVNQKVFNTAGVGRGTRAIYLYVAKKGALKNSFDEIADEDWTPIYAFDEDNPTEGNVSGLVRHVAAMAGLENGDEFVLYVKAQDNADGALAEETNVTYVSSALLKLDTEAPTVTLSESEEEGEQGSNATETTEASKFCLAAVVTVAGADTVTLDGEPITLTEVTVTDPETEITTTTYEYKVTTAGKHTIVAADEAGNETIKVFEVVGSHNLITRTKDTTCGVVGYTDKKCLTCGAVFEHVDDDEENAEHRFELRKTVQQTCVQGGYELYVCGRCGETKKENETDPTGIHSWSEATISVERNCTDNAVVSYTCNVCGTPDYVSGDLFDPDSDGFNQEAREEKLEAHPDLAGLSLVHDGSTHDWSPFIQKASTCTAHGEKYRVCKRCGEEDSETADHNLPLAAHVENPMPIIDQTATCQVPEIKHYVCKNCGATIRTVTGTVGDHDFSGEADANGRIYCAYGCGEFIEAATAKEVTFTFVYGEITKNVTVRAGEQLTDAAIDLNPTKDPTEAFTYRFKGWTEAELVDGVWVAKDDSEPVLDLPLTVKQSDENATYIPAFKATAITYTITFLNENGSTYQTVSNKRIGDEVTVTAPTKQSDENKYTFEGWKVAVWQDPAEGETEGRWVASGNVVPLPIVCAGNDTYIASFKSEPLRFTVTWRVGTVAIDIDENVVPGTLLSTLKPSDDDARNAKPNDSLNHYTFTGWNVDLTTQVNEDIDVKALFSSARHNYPSTPSEVEQPTCTEAGKNIFICPTCHYRFEAVGKAALGHNYELLNRVNPTATTNGSKTEKCSRCGDIRTVDLTPIFLKVTVRDQNGNPVSGVKVYVYDDDVDSANPVGTGTTNNSGEATIVVPEAKTYRVVVEGNTGSVTVDQNGNITGGGVPTVTRGGGGNPTPSSHGCDCTCHKSGFWPMIFRFFHKIIKMITGEFRCCTDANY